MINTSKLTAQNGKQSVYQFFFNWFSFIPAFYMSDSLNSLLTMWMKIETAFFSAKAINNFIFHSSQHAHTHKTYIHSAGMFFPTVCIHFAFIPCHLLWSQIILYYSLFLRYEQQQQQHKNHAKFDESNNSKLIPQLDLMRFRDGRLLRKSFVPCMYYKLMQYPFFFTNFPNTRKGA